MPQLKMYRLPGTPYKQSLLPDGFSISKYKSEEDKQAWADCCKNGLVSDTAGPAQFDKSILSRDGLNPYEDVFFIDYEGKHIGTVTAYIHPDDGTGDMHMVGIRKEFRGLGLSNYLTCLTINHLDNRVPYIHLTTDDWRKPAIKGYLSGGFSPVIYSEWMERRWQSIANQFGLENLRTYNNDTTPGPVISRRKTLKFGAVGNKCARIIGEYAKTHDDALLCCTYSPDGPLSDYDEFFAKDMDCIILEGGSLLAIEAMKTGLSVLNSGNKPENPQLLENLESEIFKRGQIYRCLSADFCDEEITAFINACKGIK